MNSLKKSLDVVRGLKKVNKATKHINSSSDRVRKIKESEDTSALKRFPDGASKLQPLANTTSEDLEYSPLEVPDQPDVPKLANSLDKVLFNGGGVYFLKDPRTNVYNFDHRLENIMSIADFDFSKVPPYIPAGRDSKLAEIAAHNGYQYTGSTSSMTGVLTQLHHALSHRRPPQILELSKYFRGRVTSFTATQRAPASFWLTETTARKENGENIYSITQPTQKKSEFILTLLGQAMEIMLTTSCTEFAEYSKTAASSNPQKVPVGSSTYNYTASGKLLMRSQLDCYDPRLPGTGMFDLKTRACCAVRQDLDYAQINDGSGYQILKRNGQFESFEREYFELVRSSLFKYSLQARIGRMDGIFVAYHSVRKLFGFQYLPLTEIDKVFHTSQLLLQGNDSFNGSSEVRAAAAATAETTGDLKYFDLESQLSVASHIADAEFKLSLNLLEEILEKLRHSVLDPVRQKDCNKTDLNIVVHCIGPGLLAVAAQPGRAENDKGILSSDDPPVGVRVFGIELTQYINGKVVSREEFPSPKDSSEPWTVSSGIYEYPKSDAQKLIKGMKEAHISQILTSEPQTTQRPTEELIQQSLKKLPEATQLQRILRAFEKKGLTYSKWDRERHKQVA